jgi:multiple sugar transport system permease protein|tara:strand:+ start:4046 stop:4906 length:861 start_codon:yes stop_codon:yes gene_type:complete
MTRKQINNILIWLATIILVIIIMIPGLWVMLSAFRPQVDIMAKPAVWIPRNLSLLQFETMLFGGSEGSMGRSAVPVLDYLINSFTISILSTVIAVIVGTMGGYAFARYNFKGKNKYFLGIMLTRTVPGISLSLPLFILFARIGLIDTDFGIIIVYVALNIPFTVWLTDGFFRQIPKAMSEVAMTDGCTKLQAFWHIELPLAKSGIASAGIFAFLISWNEFAIVSSLARSTDSKTLTVGLMDFTAQFVINWPGMCALAVVIIIPAFILTFLVQKHLVSGLTFGGVKG